MHLTITVAKPVDRLSAIVAMVGLGIAAGDSPNIIIWAAYSAATWHLASTAIGRLGPLRELVQAIVYLRLQGTGDVGST